MSQVSNVHNLVPYVSGKSRPLGDQYLSVVSYKVTEKMKKAGKSAPFPAVCVSIPVIPTDGILGKLEGFDSHIAGWVTSQRDKLIRSLYEGSKGTRKTVSDEEIGIPALLAFLDAENQSDRLTIEAIGKWFDAKMEDIVSVFVADALKYEGTLTEEQIKRVEQATKARRDLFTCLPKTMVWADKQIHALNQLMPLIDEDDTFGQKVAAKWREMTAAGDLDTLDL